MRLAVGVVLISLLALSGQANATLTKRCYADKSSHPWGAPKATIPIYIIAGGSNSLLAATGMTLVDAEYAVKRAMTIWGE